MVVSSRENRRRGARTPRARVLTACCVASLGGLALITLLAQPRSTPPPSAPVTGTVAAAYSTSSANSTALTGAGSAKPGSGASAMAPAPSLLPPPTPMPAPTASPPPPPPFRVEPVTVVKLEQGLGPLDGSVAVGPHPSFEVRDAAGLPMDIVCGRKVYKPAALGQLAIRFMNGYWASGRNDAYLELPEKVAALFHRIGKHSGGGLYIPYQFDFAMHRNPADVIRAPWYSAMAQGLALSLYARLYGATGDPADLATAKELFLSLRHIGRGTAPWVSYVDASRDLWLEEYAQAQPEHTINGFFFAAFGIYDYWRETGDPVALQAFKGAITTMRHHVLDARNPGGPMDYCLKHGKPQIKYHWIVVGQLRMVVRITHDQFFARAASLFASDG